jgi:hypothetical protein
MVHYCMVWDKHIMDIKFDDSVIRRISVLMGMQNGDKRGS